MEKYGIEQWTTGEWAVYGPKRGKEYDLLHIAATAQKAARWLIAHFQFRGIK